MVLVFSDTTESSKRPSLLPTILGSIICDTARLLRPTLPDTMDVKDIIEEEKEEVIPTTITAATVHEQSQGDSTKEYVTDVTTTMTTTAVISSIPPEDENNLESNPILPPTADIEPSSPSQSLLSTNYESLLSLSEALESETKQQQNQRYFYDTPSIFRRVVRYGSYTSTTLNICPGYLQCNLVVLRKGQLAFDFLLFCQRNPKSCPLIEVCDYQSMYPPKSLAHDDADLRTDIPKYCIYRYGKLCHVVNNVQEFWPEDSVAFLLGTSFTFDFELMKAGVRLRSIEAGLNMPMYQTNIPWYGYKIPSFFTKR